MANWKTPESATVRFVNTARYDRLRVQAGSGANAGQFRVVLSRVPTSPNSSVPFSNWFGDREGAEGNILNLVGQLGPLWLETEQKEYVNFEQFDQIEIRQQSGGENDGKWKAYATRIVGGEEQVEDLSNWKAGRAGAAAVAENIVGRLDALVVALRAAGA